MKQFYIEVNGQQSEPMGFEELKSKSINRETLVWFEGLDGWKKAASIPELEDLFKSIPPPIIKEVPPPLSKNNFVEEERGSFLSENKNKILAVSLSLVIVLFVVFSFGNKHKTDVEIKTQQNTAVIEKQQQQLEEQNAKIAEQEKIERERAERERKEAIQNKINEIAQQLDIQYENLEKAKKQLNDATAFQLLRSSGERNQDINRANENLELVKTNINALEEEMRKLNNDL